MDNAFNRSALTQRSPPSTPTPKPSPAPKPPEEEFALVSTPEIQGWLSSINECLNEVCSISSDGGKLNTEQKIKINKLCRNVGHAVSQLAVHYQAVKQRVVTGQANIQALNAKCALADNLQDIKLSITESLSKAPMHSFADIVKKGSNDKIRPNTQSSIAIYPTDKETSSEDTKSLVQKIICPEQLKLHVTGFRKTRNGGVIISTESKDDVEKLKRSQQLTKSGLTIEEPTKRNPRIIILGVPSTLTDTELKDCIFEQNLADKLPNMSRDEILSSMKFSHKSGKKNTPTCNFVLEVPASIRKALISQQRVYVNWSSYPVRDFTLVTRCFNCQQYGHASTTCRETTPTCSHCGELGHAANDCTKKEETPKCATCLRYKKTSSHKTGESDCPARKIAEDRYIKSVDYVGA